MKARILIIDDDKDIRTVLRNILESYGYLCNEAAEALTALNEIQSQRFDLVLTDYQMPMMDGIQFLKSLSDQSGTPSVPVIMITGIGDDQTKAKALQAGAVAMFTKPLNFDELLLVIKQVISKSHKFDSCPCVKE